MIPLARNTLIHEWRRYLPSLMSITFSGILLLVQSALVYGIFGASTVYITRSGADLWVGHSGTESFDLGRNIPADTEYRLLLNSAVDHIEKYYLASGEWITPRGGKAVSVQVSGIDPARGGIVFDHALTQELRQRLYEFGTIIVDSNDLGKLGLANGGQGIINGHRVRVAGTTQGLGGLGGVNVLASLATARWLSGETRGENGITYLALRLAHDAPAPAAVAADLDRQLGTGLDVWTGQRFGRMTMIYWLFDTGAGLGIIFLTLIVISVGIAVTSQTLMGTVVHSLKEFATLIALGVSFGNLRKIVLEQSAWLGGAGIGIAGLAGTSILWLASLQGVPVQLNLAIVLVLVSMVMVIILVSGLFAVGTLRHADPSGLLR